MVFVAVGQHHPAEGVAPLAQIGEVRDDVVDPRQLVVGEHEAAVDGDEIVAELDQHHVQADLAESTQGDQPDGRFHSTPFDARLIVASALAGPKFLQWHDSWSLFGPCESSA